MKTLIAIIIILLVGLGIWWARRGPDTVDNTPNSAAVGNADIYGNSGTSTDNSLNGSDADTPYEDKG